MNTITLWRPVGNQELALIEESGFKRFPPRLPSQPIFYPVCNEAYAWQISEWNANGIVTKFEIAEDFILQYEKQRVGSRIHEEYWIPADDLDAFNVAIVGTIQIVRK